ncbi:MAG: energy-coupled thiamine transporter ThiT [Bacillota bacterium]
MRNKKVSVMVEIALCVALAYVLGLIKLWQMPFGGSVSLEMIPIFIVALRRGWIAGMTGGLVYGFVNLMVDGMQWIVHPVQLVLDYPLPFALLGLAGCFPGSPFLGVVIGSLGRFLSHFVSGFVFWGAYGSEYGLSPVVYSIAYNSMYLLPEMLISLACVLVLVKRPDILQPVQGPKSMGE